MERWKEQEFLKKELAEMKNAKIPFCENTLINAVLSEYRTKAEQEGLEFSARVTDAKGDCCDENEFCVMLSNLLENSLDRQKKLYCNQHQAFKPSALFKCKSKNDYEGD